MPTAKKKPAKAKKPVPEPKIRDRIKELRRVKASDLVANERNWRKHPASQVAALTGSLEEIGWADVAIAYEVDGDLVLIDGHCRAGVADDAMVPVIVLDVNEDEADKLLATLDPITAMATTDQMALDDLIAGLQGGNEALDEMVEKLATPVDIPEVAPAGIPVYPKPVCPNCGQTTP